MIIGVCHCDTRLCFLPNASFSFLSLLVGAIFNRPNHCFFHFLGFGRLEIAPTVRENYSEGKLLILIAFIACRGDFQSPESLLFHFLGFVRLEIAPTVREDYSEGKLLIFIALIACMGDLQSPEALLFSFPRFRAIRNRPYCPRGLSRVNC